eukprot:CAMPEP_0172575890 /NCGR_PEP_ID=MMETSP1067-20121228/137442_1 /TAXON_ID=265564 ORGANISM="Thalassiosira punctigera, Strain Tpunct2005C2" /NCGR_SAMPLE_ID=MMETSP1067 /ASSEMBLY_ACC=CAM_ASM_000444 /LENGTH=583 /DNA_ID=CAMNT_0013368545 /DNA_START=181 /DNA_END=1932 /DNA_ORIENTATION=-
MTTIAMYEQEKSEIQILKSYLLSQVPTTPLPPNDVLLSPNSVALKAAIAGLDKELMRLEREERLVKKFTTGNEAVAAGGGAAGKNGKGTDDDDAADMEYVKMTKEDAAAAAATDAGQDDVAMGDEKDDEEWEEADPSPAKKHPRQEEGPSRRCDAEIVCEKLASLAVSRIANAKAKVDTPLGALGLALHVALAELTDDGDRGEAVFRCTGVPDASVTGRLLGIAPKKGKGGGGGGFAPPIRELPRGQLAPPKWEENAETRVDGGGGMIAFRYKCGKEVYSNNSGHTNDATTVYLALHLLSGTDVAVTFGTLPSSKDKTDAKQLKFTLGQHVNLDGFAAAKTKSGGGSVPPSLFYVSLSDLLTKFSSLFGLLASMQKQEGSLSGMQIVTNAAVQSLPSIPSKATAASTDFDQFRPRLPPVRAAADSADVTNIDPLRVVNSQRRGDFDADLLPGGPQPGGLHQLPPGGGSHVGPNHPMFDRTFGDEDYGGSYDDFGGGFGSGGGSFGVPGVGGGMGMRPRFDPYGPPGGPTEPGRGRGQFPGRGSRLGSLRGGRGGRGGRGRVPPGGFGTPNPDHMTPPGGDYFS